MRGWSAIAIAVLALGALTGGAAYEHAALARRTDWREIAWPFPRDGWPAGARVSLCQRAAALSKSMCGRRSASAIATAVSPMTTKSTASPISI